MLVKTRCLFYQFRLQRQKVEQQKEDLEGGTRTPDQWRFNQRQSLQSNALPSAPPRDTDYNEQMYINTD